MYRYLYIYVCICTYIYVYICIHIDTHRAHSAGSPRHQDPKKGARHTKFPKGVPERPDAMNGELISEDSDRRTVLAQEGVVTR